MTDQVEEQRGECRRQPNVEVSMHDLETIGVIYHRIPEEEGDKLESFAKEHGYDYQDEIVISRDKLDNYEEKMQIFFREHLHDNDEVRYVLDGSGYFDVRNEEDQWIRIEVKQGDLLVLPAGIYHRFTVDTMDFISVRRLFHGAPIWTPFNRPGADQMPVRLGYRRRFLNDNVD